LNKAVLDPNVGNAVQETQAFVKMADILQSTIRQGVSRRLLIPPAKTNVKVFQFLYTIFETHLLY